MTMLDRVSDIIRDIPIGTLIFLGLLLWGFVGKKTPRTNRETRPHQPQASPEPATYASDERRSQEREEWGHPDFGTADDRYGDANQWGQTKYGFDPAEWGSTFDDRDDDDPRVH
ncbi:MAG TPA: hypothetical protein VNZ55_04115 [Thermomicrobiales bacterium]|nr:hypothetical protein [Thermomicrobiales bacterium]